MPHKIPRCQIQIQRSANATIDATKVTHGNLNNKRIKLPNLTKFDATQKSPKKGGMLIIISIFFKIITLIFYLFYYRKPRNSAPHHCKEDFFWGDTIAGFTVFYQSPYLEKFFYKFL